MEWKEREEINYKIPAAFVAEALHCIGMDYRPPYRKVGKLFYKPFRNAVCVGKETEEGKVWEQAFELGLAKKKNGGEKNNYYGLTEKGRDWLSDLILIKIYEEDL